MVSIAMKNFFMRNEKVCCRICQLMLGLVVLLRLSIVYRGGFFTDTRFWVETANFVRQGLNPYLPEVYLTKFGIPPVQAPSMTFLAMPLVFCSIPIQNCIIFLLGTLSYAFFCIIVFQYYGFSYRDFGAPQWKNLPVWFILACLFNSSPFLGMLRAGQNSSIAACLLFAALFSPAHDKYRNIFLLGLSAAVKYSMMTLMAPILVLQKRWKMSLLAFGFFVALCLTLAFWLDDIQAILKHSRPIIAENR